MRVHRLATHCTCTLPLGSWSMTAGPATTCVAAAVGASSGADEEVQMVIYIYIYTYIYTYRYK